MRLFSTKLRSEMIYQLARKNAGPDALRHSVENVFKIDLLQFPMHSEKFPNFYEKSATGT